VNSIGEKSKCIKLKIILEEYFAVIYIYMFPLKHLHLKTIPVMYYYIGTHILLASFHNIYYSIVEMRFQAKSMWIICKI
jgi:hypothetical protein